MKKFIISISILIVFILNIETVFAESIVSVNVSDVYKITGEKVNGIARYIVDIERTGTSVVQGTAKNLTVFNKIFPRVWGEDRGFYFWNQSGYVSSRDLTSLMDVKLIENGPMRVFVHSENSSSAYGPASDCWEGAGICWNVSTNIYAYPKYYIELIKVWGNFSFAQMYVGNPVWKSPYTFDKEGNSPVFNAVAWYWLNGTYMDGNNTLAVTIKKNNFNNSVVFIFNETGHNKTIARFPLQTSIQNPPQSSWETVYPPYYYTYLGFNGGKNPSPYIFGFGFFFSDSGNKSLQENYSVWLGFKDQWFDLYYPASISIINGTYEGRDNITLTYNFSVDSSGLLRFNFSTNGIKHSLPVFHIKNTFSLSNYKDHIWMKNYSEPNPTWKKLVNWTDFVIQEGNSSHFGYNYTLLLINKTLGSDYEFWISNSSDPSNIYKVECETGGPYVKGSTINIIGNTSYLDGSPVSLDVNIQLIKNGNLILSTNTISDSDGKFLKTITQTLDPGTYLVNISAGLAGSYAYCSDILIINYSKPEEKCENKTIEVSGFLVYSDSGQLVPSGKVVLSILETNEKNQTSFTQGKFSISLTSCLFLGKKYTLVVYTTDESGKESWFYRTIIST